jgi:hypothetical protein
MQRFGNDESGFSVVWEDASGTVRVKAWGFWDAGLSASFSRAVGGVCRSARRPLKLFVDAMMLKPQRDEGQAAFRALMTILVSLGGVRAAVAVGNAITRIQLVRIAKETSAEGWSFLATEGSAAEALE